MQTVLPLVRSASHAVTLSASRIPHLEYHIVRKLHRSKKSDNVTNAKSQQLRYRSSTADVNLSAIWPAATYEGSIATEQERDSLTSEHVYSDISKPKPRIIDFNANQVPDVSSSHSPGFIDLSSSSHLVSASTLLEEGSPERLLTWLAAHPAGHAFTASATSEEFDKAFCALDPGIIVDPFVRAQRYLGKATDVDWELSFRRSLVSRMRTFASTIDEILVRRREFGTRLTLNSCRHALKCAASVGDAHIADHIWDNLMTPAGIEPDIACYNSYLHAYIWNLAHSEISRRSFRNTKRSLELRSKFRRPRNLLGYRVSTQQPEPDWALRQRVLAIFQDITNKGLITDEQVFVNLIMGLGRSADLSGVGSILKSVWNVDVDALDDYDEEELESPTFYPEAHPLRPTAQLLSAVVHAYAINHQVSKAWNLLDYISRNYALLIPDYIWDELIEWTFVLSIPRSKVQRDQGQMEGKIHMREVENLVNTLTDEPHNVKPSPIIRDLLTRSYRKRHMLDRSLETMREAERVMMEDLEELDLMINTIKAMLQNPRGVIDNGMLSQKFIKFRNDFQLAYLSIRQQYAFFINETRRIIQERDFSGSGKETTWSYQRLPQIVEEFTQYLPNDCSYHTKSGHISLHIAEDRDAVQDSGPMRSLLLEANAIWEALDTIDLFQMAGDLHHLAEKLQEIQQRPRNREPDEAAGLD